MKQLITFALAACALASFAQPYTEKKTSERFAQTVFGANISRVQLNNDLAVIIIDGQEKKVDLGESYSPGITFFSGLHFWGHAEFFVKYQFGVKARAMFSPDSVSVEYDGKFKSGFETGAKFYPLRLKDKRVSPMIGISWQLVEYNAKYKVNDSEMKMPSAFRSMVPVLFGLTYMRKKLILDLGYIYYYNRMNVPVLSMDVDGYSVQRRLQKIAKGSIEAGLRFYFDSSVNAEQYRDKLKMRAQYLEEKGKLNGITYGIGLSSMQFLKPSPLLSNSKEGYSVKAGSTVFPELSFGYHFQKAGAELRIAYRGLTNIAHESSFKGNYTIRQESVSLEAIKVFDKLSYHGFIPFAGIGYARDLTDISGSSFGNTRENQGNVPIVCGWDIDVMGHAPFVLRTNLRYNFNRSLMINDQRLNLDNLEVNFIQATWFPSRKIKKQNNPQPQN